MLRTLDIGLDDMTSRGQENAPLRMVVTVAVAAISAMVLPLKTALGWAVVVLLVEALVWLAVQARKRGRLSPDASRLIVLGLFMIGAAFWLALGMAGWATGKPEGLVLAMDIWLSLIFFGQVNAYRAMIGFIVGTAAPGLAVILWLAVGPNPAEVQILPIISLFSLSVLFACDGVLRALKSRRSLEEAQAKLQASESQYRLLADNVSDVIALNSLDGRRLYLSPSIERAMGYSPEELFRTQNYTFLHPEDGEWLPQKLSALAQAGGQTTERYRIMHKDGHPVWVETNFGVISPSEPGESPMLISVSRNIDAQVRMEEELKEATRRAEAAAAAKSDFLANMTHELRTPLNAIIGFSSILRASPRLQAEDARHAKLINDASQSLLELVNDVLDFSKLEAGAAEAETRAFDPHDICGGVTELLQDQAAAKRLSLEFAPEGEHRALAGDPARIRQVLMNFLSNALKFTSQGRIRLRLIQTPAEARCDLMRVEVTDTGIGIPADQIAQLFDRFTQADASVSRRYGGTGLGLAICKRNVELMGGRIGAESEPGVGSTFWFELTLPRAQPAAEPESDAAAKPDGALRLLVVEDVAVNRELIQTLLSPFDIKITTAENGVEALQHLQDEPFDIVLMDVQMPVMDGLTATRAIRALPCDRARRTPIIAMTANVLPEQICACMEAGMNDHLGKPISPADLLSALSRWGPQTEAA